MMTQGTLFQPTLIHELTIHSTHVKENKKKDKLELVKSRLFSEVYGENDELIYKRINADEITALDEDALDFLATFTLTNGRFYRLLNTYYFVQDGELIEKSYEQVYDAFISVDYQPKGKLVKLPLTYHPKTFFEKTSATVFWTEDEEKLFKKSLTRRKDDKMQLEEIREELSDAPKNVQYIARYYTKDLHLGKDAPLLRKYVSRVPFDEKDPSESYAWVTEGQYYELVEGNKATKEDLINSAAVYCEDGELIPAEDVFEKVVQANKRKQSHEMLELYYWKDKLFHEVMDIIALRKDLQDLYQIYYKEIYLDAHTDENFSFLTMFRKIRTKTNEATDTFQPKLGMTPTELFKSYQNTLRLKQSLKDTLTALGTAIAHGKVDTSLHLTDDEEWVFEVAE